MLRLAGAFATIAALAFAVGVAASPARAAALQIGGIAGLANINISPSLPVQSFQARRFSAVIPQKYD